MKTLDGQGIVSFIDGQKFTSLINEQKTTSVVDGQALSAFKYNFNGGACRLELREYHLCGYKHNQSLIHVNLRSKFF